jgi:transcriptional regulator with XRE-family HTH domain
MSLPSWLGAVPGNPPWSTIGFGGLKASRKLLGRKQNDFCERCGLERSYFDGVERGKCNLTFSNICQICNGFNCDIAAVTEGIPHPAEAPKQPNKEEPKDATLLSIKRRKPISYFGQGVICCR